MSTPQESSVSSGSVFENQSRADGHPLQWYDYEFEKALLNASDSTWLNKLRGKKVDERWLAEANEVIAIGSISLREDTDPETISSVMRARREFFGEMLGWSNEQHPLHDAYTEMQDANVRIIPLATVIAGQRKMTEYDLDAVKIIKSNYRAAFQSASSIEEKVSTLVGLGLDQRKIINSFPAVLHYSADSLNEKVSNLNDLGLDVKRILVRSPSILGYRPSKIRTKVEELKTIFEDENLTETMNIFPSLLARSSDAIRENIEMLQDLGLDSKKIIKLNPSTLGYNPASMRRKIKYIDDMTRVLGWEGSVSQLVNSYPAILGLSNKKLYAHARLFSKYGRADMTPSQVSQLLVAPLETHLIAIGEGHVNGRADYRQTKLKNITKKSTLEERTERVKKVLEDPTLTQKIGRKAILAHQSCRS